LKLKSLKADTFIEHESEQFGAFGENGQPSFEPNGADEHDNVV